MTLSIASFADLLGIETFTASPGRQSQYSGNGSGGGWREDIAPAIREWDVTTISHENAMVARLIAKIERLDQMNEDFYIYDPRKAYPAYDPSGAITAGLTVQINSLGSDNHSISLKGLSAAFVMTEGDLLCWDYSSSPTRRAYHRCVETVTANGSGVTAEFDVTDFILGGAADATVTLIKPSMKAKIVSRSLRDNSDGKMTTRLAFKVKQVI